MTDYRINIFYSKADDGYVADIPDLDACSAFGRTPDEALAELKKAKAAWLQAAQETGKSVPPARYRPVLGRTAGDRGDAQAAQQAVDRGPSFPPCNRQTGN